MHRKSVMCEMHRSIKSRSSRSTTDKPHSANCLLAVYNFGHGCFAQFSELLVLQRIDLLPGEYTISSSVLTLSDLAIRYMIKQ